MRDLFTNGEAKKTVGVGAVGLGGGSLITILLYALLSGQITLGSAAPLKPDDIVTSKEFTEYKDNHKENIDLLLQARVIPVLAELALLKEQNARMEDRLETIERLLRRQ